MSEEKVVLITGASSGFGKSARALLAGRGYKVYGTSRRPQSESDGKVWMLTLDVDSDASVEACVGTLLGREGRIDVLVNNAGTALTGGAEETSIEEAKAHFETNFFGAVRVTKVVLPIMRRQKGGKIINIGSIAAKMPAPFEGYYAAGKAALLAYSDALRHEVSSLNISVSVVEPGFFRTNLPNQRRAAAAKIHDYDGMRERAEAQLLHDFETGPDPSRVAETILKIVEDRSPRLEYIVGREKRYVTLKKFMPASSFESSFRKHWKLDA
ncbi:MAG: SDR family NAD(P)-dependent oxidoreductase [Thaumarchaeota archaeon]|nr:SDR family NAD(P)-dependent oxidoreductase [Nitrososphaerota archaeon]